MQLSLTISYSLVKICSVNTTKATETSDFCIINVSYLFLEAPPRIELGIRALQAPALPLGYGALSGCRQDS